MNKTRKYTVQSRSDIKSIKILETLFDEDKVISHLNRLDKIPNHDGHLELIHSNGYPIGEVKAQVKTLPKNKKKLTFPVDLETFNYALNTVQIPFIFFIVDQINKKSYWKEIDKNIASYYITKYLDEGKKQNTYSIEFDSNSEISINPPYKEWEDLIKVYRDKNNDVDFTKLKTEFEVDKNAHIVDQIDQLFDYIYSDIKFIPIDLFLKQHPFRNNFGSSYSTNTLYLNNSDINDFLQSFEIIEQKTIKLNSRKYFNGVLKPLEKSKKILSRFTSNLIYYVNPSESTDWIDIRFVEESNCPCSRCQIEKFNFKDLVFNKKVKESPVEDLMSRAYGHYKVGHFKKSYRLYKEVIKVSESEDKPLSNYLAKYNLSHLATLIENYNYGDKESVKISKELRSIDLSNSICETTSEFNRGIIDQMHNDFYIEQFYSRISELKKKIVDHYFSSINGGTSSNNHVRELANIFLQFDRFLQQNTIISDCYKPYFDISDIYIEGLLASYATHGKNNSKLIHFIDWILIHMLKKGKAFTIRKFMSRYNIKTLKYESGDEQNSVKKHILRLIDQYSEAFKKVRTVEEPNHRYFESKYNTWVENALYLTGVVEFDKAFVKEFATVFIKNFSSYKLNISSYEINSFLINKYQVLTKSQLKEFFLLGIKNEDLFRSLLDSLTFICDKENKHFKLSKDEYDKIIAISDNHRITQVYQCISGENQKTDIEKRIINELTNHFSVSLWIKAVKCEMIKFEDPFLELVIQELKPQDYSNMVGMPYRTTNRENYNSTLDKFIDVCYKLDIDLTNQKYDELRDHSEYYKWLLDLDGFNYDLFKPKWLTEYGSKHYYDRFAECNVLKEHVESLFQNPKLEEKDKLRDAYVNIFVVGK